ncbi:hypothetical protein HF086_011486, partial [Spodoptera exigua]
LLELQAKCQSLTFKDVERMWFKNISNHTETIMKERGMEKNYGTDSQNLEKIVDENITKFKENKTNEKDHKLNEESSGMISNLYKTDGGGSGWMLNKLEPIKNEKTKDQNLIHTKVPPSLLNKTKKIEPANDANEENKHMSIKNETDNENNNASGKLSTSSLIVTKTIKLANGVKEGNKTTQNENNKEKALGIEEMPPFLLNETKTIKPAYDGYKEDKHESIKNETDNDKSIVLGKKSPTALIETKMTELTNNEEANEKKIRSQKNLSFTFK